MLQQTNIDQDRLVTVVDDVNRAYEQGDYERIHRLVIAETPAVWFGLESDRFFEIIRALIDNYPATDILIRTCYEMVAASGPGGFDASEVIQSLDPDNPQQMFFLTLFKMFEYRLHGYPIHALEQAEILRDYLGKIHPFAASNAGWRLHVPIQVGVSAMLAGDFSRALTAFTEAQLHPPLPTFYFSTRDALVKSALVQAFCGNLPAARSLLERADDIPKTSSWIEAQIDAHRDLAAVLVETESPEWALEKLQMINLHDIGEMWPFYISTAFRLGRALRQYDELEHQMDMFDDMPLSKQDGEGFSGSIIPLKKATIAMRSGRVTEAQQLIDRADPRLTYTRIAQTALHLYAGRPKQAIQDALQLYDDTRGYRLFELRRLSLLATAHLQANDTNSALDVLTQAARLPDGLQAHEVLVFSPECRELAQDQVANWPPENPATSVFLTNLPKPGLALTDREIEIVKQLAQGHTRAVIAESLYISVNTLKTQLRSIYRKLNVSSREDAVHGAQRRGLL